MRIYTPPPEKATLIHPVFYFKYPPKDRGGGLFRDVDQTFFKESEVDDVESGDVIVLAHNFAKEPDESQRAYIKQYADLGEKLQKPVFIFSCGDFSDKITFDERVWVFRYSLYKATQGPRDIATPTVTEDPPENLLFIQKKRSIPLVSFCGQGGFKTYSEWIKYYLKTLWIQAVSVLSPHQKAYLLGVYWRRNMMAACKRSSLVATNFIVRGSFSGHQNTIELDPKQARLEYLETTANADFVLAPKGDGNYSNRFLKTLAFGRIPVLVDTDVVLPLAKEIDYTKIMVKVPMDKVEKTPTLVRAFYDSLSEEEWTKRQELAREIFNTYLKQDAFFRHYFTSWQKQ